MIMDNVTREKMKQETIFHVAMAIVWVIAAMLVVVFKESVTWVFGVTVVVYLAVDELINVFFFYRMWRSNGRVSEVQKKGEEKDAEKE